MIEDVEDLQHVAMKLARVAPWRYEGVLGRSRGNIVESVERGMPKSEPAPVRLS
jgi:hypothetical protein